METNTPSEQPGAAHGTTRVSVVIPAFNRERYLGPTIESVLGQTFCRWELIVYDDGSTDRTLDVARSYARTDPRIRAAHGPNGGVAAARNRGFDLADTEAEFVIFLDSDDLWEADALDALVENLDAHPDYVGSYGVARCVDDDGQFVPGDDLAERCRDRRGFRGGHLVPVPPQEPTTFAELVYHYWMVTPGTQLLRQHVVRRVGGFDPATDPADDADLAVRVSRLGDLGFVDHPVLRWRRHPDTLTNTSPRWRAAALRVRAKTLTDPANTPAQRQAMRLAYLYAVRTTWHEGRCAAGRRAYGEAVHEMLKAISLYEAYLRADITQFARRAWFSVPSVDRTSTPATCRNPSRRRERCRRHNR
jgi:glycosyltransferase involved in cell wall biosynthesis